MGIQEQQNTLLLQQQQQQQRQKEERRCPVEIDNDDNDNDAEDGIFDRGFGDGGAKVTSTSTSTPTPSSTHASLSTRIVSGSIGSLATSLLVTPLDVVKVRMQAYQSSALHPPALSHVHPIPPYVTPCPKGCGTFVLNNGQMECVLPKSAVSYFDKTTGQLTEQAMNLFKSTASTYCGGSSSTTTSSSSTNAKQATDVSTAKSSASRSASAEIGTFAMLRRIFRAEGFNGIYAGLRPTLVMALPNTVLYFSAYDEMVYRLRDTSNRSSSRGTVQKEDPSTTTSATMEWWIPLVSGGTARVVASVATAPFEFLRTRQASMVGDGAPSLGIVHDFRTIVRDEGGYSALYKGLRSTLWRDVPFSAIYWVSLEKLRDTWTQRRLNNDNDQFTISPSTQALQAFFNGAVSGMIAAACTTPFDVVKTRQQQVLSGVTAAAAAAAAAASTATTTATTSMTPIHRATTAATTSSATSAASLSITCTHDGAAVYEPPPSLSATNGATGSHHHHHHSSNPAKNATTMAGQLRYIAQTEGVQGLWRGNQARMLKVAPACAIMISSYELGKRLLE